jgi:antitoxin VapB
MVYRNGRLVSGMGLNIKKDETHRLARELAELTGESMTEAVTQAVRERLARLRRERAGGLADRLLTIGRDALLPILRDEPEAATCAEAIANHEVTRA